MGIWKKLIKRSGAGPGKVSVKYLSVEGITPNPFQPRKHFDEDRLNELALSIKEYGVIQPILVRLTRGGYELVAGERRLRASKVAGLKKIPAIIRELSDTQIIEVSFLENLQREQMNEFEEAETYMRLCKEFVFLTKEELGAKIGKDAAEITAKLWILNLPMYLRQAILRNLITVEHAKLLMKLPEEEVQKKLLVMIGREALSVKETAGIIEKFLKEHYQKQQVLEDIVKNAVNNELISEDHAELIEQSNLPPKMVIRVIEYVGHKHLDMVQTRGFIEKLRQKISVAV